MSRCCWQCCYFPFSFSSLFADKSCRDISRVLPITLCDNADLCISLVMNESWSHFNCREKMLVTSRFHWQRLYFPISVSFWGMRHISADKSCRDVSRMLRTTLSKNMLQLRYSVVTNESWSRFNRACSCSNTFMSCPAVVGAAVIFLFGGWDIFSLTNYIFLLVSFAVVVSVCILISKK